MLGLALAVPLGAQPAAPAAKPGDGVTTMAKFEVTGVPIEQQILPTSRPFNSVFGTDDNIIDVPRNVTIISRQQLSDIAISDVLDFSKLTSSAFTTTNFGAPSNASIRGQSADVFLNGVRSRITSNGNGLPIDFNSVESVNIVKGPATAVQGTSMYVGGFIDLVSKRPYFDSAKGSISYTLGSYNTNKWTLDYGAPISKTAAYRFSYSGEETQGYYIDGHKRTHSLYGALTLRPSKDWEFFLNGQAFVANYTENWGVNRPTQDLVDNGNYITGININNGATATPSDPQNSRFVLGGGNTIARGPVVKINRHTRLLRPGNQSYGEEFNLQGILTGKPSADLTIKNTTFWSHTERNTLSTYYYTEIIDPSWFAENRTEFIFNLKGGSLNTGLDLRYQRVKAYDDYFFEPANVWDITKDRSYINVYNSVNFAPNAGFPVPGWPGRFAQPGLFNGDTNDSKGTTIGPFAQGSWKLSEAFSLIGGLRYDHITAKVREPLLPPYPTAKISVWIPNLNGSVTYKMSPTSTAYFTYNYSENTSGAVGNGGGITGWNGAGTALDKENFTQPSTLYEIGTKYSLMNSKVFLNFAIYDQKRTAKSTSSTVIQQFRYKGFEAEMNYQPNKHLYATVSYSYIDAESSAPFQYGLFGNVTELFGNAATVPIGTVTQVSGLPKHLFNGLVSYTFSNGFGLTANTVVTGEMNNNAAGTIVIPTQFTIDAGVSYTYKKWHLHATITNVTDEKNWSPPNAVYGNGSILALPGTQAQFTVKYSF
ncbi:TonB-dependent receptor [Horticoccus sp. 23ND18S-11]|uniref:TonB-dependent receptor n=1 Tax=Horticoccus sp. 23ND18S-11 TaxID=3391832 RepID=UPI0039C9BBC9